ncbi:MAG: lactate racemase domain-containing protein [Candidatus Thorarchaeota archaeon]
MDVEITYGIEKVKLSIPENNLAGIIAPKKMESKPDLLDELNRVLDNPQGPSLEELSRGKSVCVFVEDHTRDAPHWELVSSIAPRLIDANKVQFIITTGSHVVNHPANIEIVNFIKKIADDSHLSNYDVDIHDCHAEDMVDLGKTSRKTPIIVNNKAVGHDVYVSLSDMKAHYFAGYSNVVKNFLPGVCGFETIEANHAMALDPRSTFGVHPFHSDEKYRDNPLADDMKEGMEIIAGTGAVFLLAVVTDAGKLMWADAGQIIPVSSGAMDFLDDSASFTITPTPRIIVSPGGYPQDKSLYHAQRAIELTKNAVLDGGQILFLAECRDGIAPEKAIENFYNRLILPLDEVIESISGKYHLYEHKAYKFAELMKRVSKILMYSDLDTKTIEAAHMEKVENLQKVVDDWIVDDPDVKILVLDKGNKIAVYAEDQSSPLLET